MNSYYDNQGRLRPRIANKNCCSHCNEDIETIHIPSAQGSDADGQPFAPCNGAYHNKYVIYDRNDAVYYYDSKGVFVKIVSPDGSNSFNDLVDRPKYAGRVMTGETNIPDVDKAILTEATARKAKDDELNEAVLDVSTHLTAETQARIIGDNELGEDISALDERVETLEETAETLATELGVESETREATDKSLQEQIDTIVASSDVKDIIGTHAELEAYDKSTLGKNDIIKVIKDETHDDSASFYRYNDTNFDFIGSEGPYLTPAQAESIYTPMARTINGHDLAEDVVLTAEDVNAATPEDIEELDSRIDEIELFKFPNLTIIGEPTIQAGQISGFSKSNYLEFPFLVDFHNQPFEISFSFTTGNDVVSQQNILDSEFGLAFAIRNSRMVLAVSYDGRTWAFEKVGNLVIMPNTTYRVKISWSKINYKVACSTDGGETYVDDMNMGGTQQPYPRQMYIGIGKLADNVFGGSINLNYATLTIGGSIIWQGMDDAGLSTRLATDLSNIDELGKERIREIVKTNNRFTKDDYAWEQGIISSNGVPGTDTSHTYWGITIRTSTFLPMHDVMTLTKANDYLAYLFFYAEDGSFIGRYDSVSTYPSVVNKEVNFRELYPTASKFKVTIRQRTSIAPDYHANDYAVEQFDILFKNSDEYEYLSGDSDNLVSMPSLSFGDNSYASGQTLVGDLLVSFGVSDDAHSNYAEAHIFRVDTLNNTYELVNTVTHNFGHVNSVDYCKETDTLIFGNGSGDYDQIGTFYIYKNFSQLIGDFTIKRWNISGAYMFNTTNCPFRTEYKWNVVWFDSNRNNYDLAMLVTKDMEKFRVIQLGRGTNQFTYGTLQSVGTGEFNGTFRVVDEYDFDPSDTNDHVLQDMDYQSGKLYCGVSHNYPYYWALTFDRLNHVVCREIIPVYAITPSGAETNKGAAAICCNNDYVIINTGLIIVKPRQDNPASAIADMLNKLADMQHRLNDGLGA